MAFAAAVLSSAARETGKPAGDGDSGLGGTAALRRGRDCNRTFPAKRVVAERVRDALDYQVTKEGLVFIGFVLLIAIAALNTGNNLLFLIVSALLAAIAVSGAASAAELRALDLTANFPEHAFAKKACPAHITVRNLSRWLPALSIAVVRRAKKSPRRSGIGSQPSLSFPSPPPGASRGCACEI